MKGSAPRDRAQTTAALALLLGTVFWGCGFTWAKAAGEAVQRAAGLPPGAAFGPIFLLAWRFLFAAIIWLACFPSARRGWTWRSAARSAAVGLFCGTGLIVQHVGLDLTNEAVSAFLTSLTILFVPLLMLVIVRRPPRPVLWAGVGIATAGVWLMTGAQPSGFGLGELLGLGCALVFSIYILAVNAAVARDHPSRVTAGQFIVVALLCFATCAFLRGGPANLAPAQTLRILTARVVCTNLALLTVFTTVLAFGLLSFFQPGIDPTRAALIYLAEPIFATAYAAIAVGHRATTMTLAGAALILLANLLVEVLSARTRSPRHEPIALVD